MGPNPTSAAPTMGVATTHNRTPITPSKVATLVATVIARTYAANRSTLSISSPFSPRTTARS